MTTEIRNDLYQSVATLRTHAFELLGRVSDGSEGDIAATVAVRLQAVANQLGAVEAMMAPVSESD